MTKLFSLIFTVCFIVSGFSQKKEAYKLYNSKGKKVSYKKMLKQLSKADVVFFGEEHNNPIAHWLELEVTMDLSKTRDLILGAEMFETDNQQALSDYLSEKIDAKQFKDTARLWKNYKTDYKPLVEFAKKNNLKFIATNVPRKFASLVYHKGFKGLDTLSNAEKQWLPKLPIAFDATLPGYVKMLKMMEGHGGDNLPKSQALKDATMANSIATNYESGKLFIHYNGSYHSNDFEGILWYLKKQLPQLKVMTITMAEQSDISNLATKNKNKAHFIIIVPETMTKTY
jgi:uncharacterized iron-regulated protein